MSLEELYSYLRDYMDPESEKARKRYKALKNFFNWTVKKALLPDGRRLSVLDLCAGTGIAGAALLKVLREWGVEASLTLVDKRKDDILKVEGWLNGDGEVYGAVMDCLDDLSKLRGVRRRSPVGLHDAALRPISGRGSLHQRLKGSHTFRSLHDRGNGPLRCVLLQKGISRGSS